MGWTDGTYTECVSYLESALVPKQRTETLRRVVRHLRKRKDEFDAIAVCGLSGLLIGPTVADKLGKALIVVRKRDDTTTHSIKKVEGSLLGRYLILDELICSGRTISHIVSSIRENHNEHAECVGIYLYAEHISTAYDFNPNKYLSEGVDIELPIWSNTRTSKKTGLGVWL